MKKRILAATLWFAAVSSLGGFAEAFFGVPYQLGGYLGIAVAIIVVANPAGYAWGRRRSSATLTPAPRIS